MPNKARTPCAACGSLNHCAHRVRDRGPDGTRRSGYTRYPKQWRDATATAIALEPWCHAQPVCPHTDAGTPTNPLTGHHTHTRARGGTDEQQVVVLCRRCNSSVGP